MSVIEINFHLLKCFPVMNYSDFQYTICSQDRRFMDVIFHETHNTITDQIDYKADFLYYLKVKYGDELIGVANFQLESGLFYKKEKKIIKELKLTLGDNARKWLMEMSGESIMMVKILITFNYRAKQIGFKINSYNSQYYISDTSRSISTSAFHQIIKSNAKIKTQSNTKVFSNVSSSFKSPFKGSFLSSSSYQSKTNLIRRPTSSFVPINRDNKVDKSIEKHNHSLDNQDNSIIDSLLGRNDLSYSTASEGEDYMLQAMNHSSSCKVLKRKLSYEISERTRKNYTNKEMSNKIVDMTKKWREKHKYYAQRLDRNLDITKRFNKCCNRYNEQYHHLNKKEHKINHAMNKTSILNIKENEILRDLNNVKIEVLKSKNIELDILYDLFKDFGLKRKKEDTSKEIVKMSDKEFLITLFKQGIIPKGNLSKSLTLDSLEKLKIIIEKFGLDKNGYKLHDNRLKEHDKLTKIPMNKVEENCSEENQITS